MNILVTGANGQLGRCFRELAEMAPKNKYYFTDIICEDEETLYLDITNEEMVNSFINDQEIDLVLNFAAYTNVDKSGTDCYHSSQVNILAPLYLAKAVNRRGGYIIHISSDYVYGGTDNCTPYREDSPTNPLNAYGYAKLAGDEAIINNSPNYLIFRTSWLYSKYGKNFVKTMIGKILNDEDINVVFDQVGSPTYAGDLAEAIFRIVENEDYKGKYGVYHYSNEGVCSWYDFTKYIQETLHKLRPNSISYANVSNISPCRSSEFKSNVVRPSYSVMDKTKFKAVFEQEIPYWTDSLVYCISQCLDYIENVSKEGNK